MSPGPHATSSGDWAFPGRVLRGWKGLAGTPLAQGHTEPADEKQLRGTAQEAGHGFKQPTPSPARKRAAGQCPRRPRVCPVLGRRWDRADPRTPFSPPPTTLRPPFRHHLGSLLSRPPPPRPAHSGFDLHPCCPTTRSPRIIRITPSRWRPRLPPSQREPAAPTPTCVCACLRRDLVAPEAWEGPFFREMAKEKPGQGGRPASLKAAKPAQWLRSPPGRARAFSG